MWRAPVTAAVAHDAQRVGRVLHFFNRTTQATPAFVPPDLWPPNSPDLNPVDYKICGGVQERVYQSRVYSIDELKQRLLHVWHAMDQSIIDIAVDKWRLRLRACVRTRVDTTSACCDIISMPICTAMWHETFYVVLNMIWFLRLTSVIRGKFELLTFPR